ncbi:MAP microtubule affinity-regulating kinase 1 [Sorochytrium milnesiophthora]
MARTVEVDSPTPRDQARLPPAPAPAPVTAQGSVKELGNIGQYVLHKTLGAGAYGKVYFGTHALSDAPAAIKSIDKPSLTEAKLARVEREIAVLKTLRHPHVVNLQEVILNDSQVHLVMEHVDGGDLHDYIIERHSLTEPEARALFAQLVAAVHYLHTDLSLAHQDIKAANVLLSQARVVKLADFGLSEHFCSGVTKSVCVGSPLFAAPEIFLGTPIEGPECDVWSLGVILYVMVTGCTPFNGRRLSHVREAVIRGEYQLPPSKSADCEHLIRQLLTYAPSDRPTIRQVLSHAWFKDHQPRQLIKKISSSTFFEVCEDTIHSIQTSYGYSSCDVRSAVEERRYDEMMGLYLSLRARPQPKRSSSVTEASPAETALTLPGTYSARGKSRKHLASLKSFSVTLWAIGVSTLPKLIAAPAYSQFVPTVIMAAHLLLWMSAARMTISQPPPQTHTSKVMRSLSRGV